MSTDPFDMEAGDHPVDELAVRRAALAEAFPGGFRVEHPVREPYPDIPEAARAAYEADTEEEILAARRNIKLRDALIAMLADDNAVNAERGDYVPVDSNRKGHRRDKEIAVLRQKVTELETVVDEISAALASLRRHVQFHPADAEERMYIYGCTACDPTASARETERAYQDAARHAEGVWPTNPTEG